MSNKRFRHFFVATVVIFALLVGWGFTAISNTSSHNCASIKVIAIISRESVTRATSPKTQAVIAKINFPGLSHADLVKLTEENVEHEKENLRRLEQVQRSSCGSLL